MTATQATRPVGADWLEPHEHGPGKRWDGPRGCYTCERCRRIFEAQGAIASIRDGLVIMGEMAAATTEPVFEYLRSIGFVTAATATADTLEDVEQRDPTPRPRWRGEWGR